MSKKRRKITYKYLKKHGFEPDKIGLPKDYSANIIDFIKEYRNKVKFKPTLLCIAFKLNVLSNWLLMSFYRNFFYENFADGNMRFFEKPDHRLWRKLEKILDRYLLGEISFNEYKNANSELGLYLSPNTAAYFSINQDIIDKQINFLISRYEYQ